MSRPADEAWRRAMPGCPICGDLRPVHGSANLVREAHDEDGDGEHLSCRDCGFSINAPSLAVAETAWRHLQGRLHATTGEPA